MISYSRTNKYAIKVSGLFKGFNSANGTFIIEDEKNGTMELNIDELDAFVDKDVVFNFSSSEVVQE